MVNIRTKGHTAERFIADLLGGVRNLSQTRDGGADVNISGLSVEVKRQETLAVETWWKQVCRAADQNGTIPVLAYKQSRKPWVFCIPAYMLLPSMKGYISLNQEQFMVWFAHWECNV